MCSGLVQTLRRHIEEKAPHSVRAAAKEEELSAALAGTWAKCERLQKQNLKLDARIDALQGSLVLLEAELEEQQHVAKECKEVCDLLNTQLAAKEKEEGTYAGRLVSPLTPQTQRSTEHTKRAK